MLTGLIFFCCKYDCLQRRTYLSWQTSLLFIVVELEYCSGDRWQVTGGMHTFFCMQDILGNQSHIDGYLSNTKGLTNNFYMYLHESKCTYRPNSCIHLRHRMVHIIWAPTIWLMSVQCQATTDKLTLQRLRSQLTRPCKSSGGWRFSKCSFSSSTWPTQRLSTWVKVSQPWLFLYYWEGFSCKSFLLT